MKLIIDVPEYEYQHIKEIYEKNDTVEATYSYIYHGRPIEQEPCEDCIRRADVIELVSDIQDTVFGQTVIKGVEKLPSVKQEPKTGWIPVSEKLPNNDEDVLACYSQGGTEVVYYHIDNSIYPTEYKDLNETGWCNEEGDALYFEPIAWMPLPEPYEESED